MTGEKTVRIGDLLIQEGLVSEGQLAEALRVQESLKVYKPIGEICVDLGFLSSTSLKQLLRKHKKRIMIGDLLVNLKLITPEQLAEALKIQQEQGGKLGEILIRQGHLTESALLNTLTIQLGVPKIVPDPSIIDATLLQGVSREFLKEKQVIPAFRENGKIVAIMSNPLDWETIRDLSKLLNAQIEPAIASGRDILKTLEGSGQDVRLGGPKGDKQMVIGDTDLSSLAGSDNVVGILDYLVRQAITEGASDIHIEPKETSLRIRYRIDGLLRHKTDLPLGLAPNMVSRIKALCGLDIAERRRHQDGRIEARMGDKEVDLRISVYPAVYGENVVIRLLHRKTELIQLEALGFSPANRERFRQILDQPSGIILVTGPTGSGKTTALYAALNYLNDGTRSIITVEDPVEYTIEGIVQGQLNPKLGQTYTDFLKAMMRQDPDVIMVGEIRDNIAAAAVIQAALTGHKVLSTFHTDDTTGALLRLMDMGIDTFLISSTVVSVMAQRLVRVLCPHCKEKVEPDRYLLDSFHVRCADPSKYNFYRPVGCDRCGGTGFRGRTAVHELLLVNDAIREAILARKTSGQIRLIARQEAQLISMREDGFYKAAKGITSLEEVSRVVFQNESDYLVPRSAEEVFCLCEGTAPLPAVPQPSATRMAELGRREADGRLRQRGEAVPRIREGEFYRVRFDVATIEEETDQIEALFQAYREAMQENGVFVSPDKSDDFLEAVLETVRGLEIKSRAEYVEFTIQVKGGAVRIFYETIGAGTDDRPKVYRTREKGLRLVHFLLPTSGFKRAAIPARPLTERVSSSGISLASLFHLLEDKPLAGEGTQASTAEISPIQRQTGELRLTEIIDLPPRG